MEAKDVEKWLSRFEAHMPADGRLTQEIIDAVGDLPLSKPSGSPSEKEATEAIYDRVRDLAFASGYVRNVLEYRSASLSTKAWKYEKKGDTAQAAKLDAEANYWKSIAKWVDSLE